jgi:hypothetical protein
VYAFSLADLAWHRLTDPSPTTRFQIDPPADVNPDGTPVSVHTYDGELYLSNVDRLMLYGGSRWYDGNAVRTSWWFNFDALHWERKADLPVPPWLGVTSAYDPVTGHVWFRAYNQLFEYDPSTDTATPRIAQDAGISDGMKLALDPGRRTLVMIGRGTVTLYDVSRSGTTPQVGVTTTGATEILQRYAPGFEYDPVSQLLVAWAGGSDVYSLNLGTLVWTKHATIGTVTPTGADPNGTLGRFRYIPSRNLFIVVNSIGENVYLYRFAAGGRLAPPASSMGSDERGRTSPRMR